MQEAQRTLADPVFRPKQSSVMTFVSGRLGLHDFYQKPKDFEEQLFELREDLRNVPAVNKDGRTSNALEKLESSNLLRPADKELIFNALTIVRTAFKQLEATHQQRKEEKGYQWNMNWKHTRAEIDQVLEAAKILNLDALRTRDAILASIFSDCAKSRKNFIVHNIHGAQAAEIVLNQLLDMQDEENIKAANRITRAVCEHQIAPPEFMARVAAIMMCNRLSLGKFDFEIAVKPEDQDAQRVMVKGLVRSIFYKIRDPFNKENLTEDLSTINFSIAERQLLLNIGIEEWYVPHPDNPDSLIAHAVIAGDHSINYNHPEGFAKIALLRGPDTEEIFEDPTIHHSLESAMRSFADSFRVIKAEVQTLAVAGLRKTMMALARVNATMSELFSGLIIGPKDGKSEFDRASVGAAMRRAQAKEPELFAIDESTLSDTARRELNDSIKRVGAILQSWYETYGEIPFNPKDPTALTPGPGTLPFWNVPLKYPPRDENGVPDLTGMTELEQRQFLFAAKIREIAVELLRAEAWVFGSQA